MSARTEPRFTRDADLAVAVASDAEAESVIRALHAEHYRVEAMVEQDAVGRLATVRLTLPTEAEPPVIDLVDALERNLLTFWSRFGRGEGCVLHEEPHAIWFETPMATLTTTA